MLYRLSQTSRLRLRAAAVLKDVDDQSHHTSSGSCSPLHLEAQVQSACPCLAPGDSDSDTTARRPISLFLEECRPQTNGALHGLMGRWSTDGHIPGSRFGCNVLKAVAHRAVHLPFSTGG